MRKLVMVMYSNDEQDFTKQIDWDIWRRLVGFAKPYGADILMVCLSSVMIAIADVTIVDVRRIVIDDFITPGNYVGMELWIFVWLVLVALMGASVYTFIRFGGKVSSSVMHDVREKGFRRLQELSFSYYDTTPVGYILARMSSDAERLGDLLGWLLIDVFWGSTYLIFAAVMMFRINTQLTLIVLAVIPPLLAIAFYFQSIILNNWREVRKTNSQITSGFNEGIMGARTTKTLQREERNLQEFQELTGRMRKASLRSAHFSGLFYPIVSTFGAIGAALALTQGGSMVTFGNMTTGELIVFVQLTISFYDPVRELSRIFTEMQASQASLERIFSLLALEPDIADSPEVEAVYGNSFHPKRENWEAIHGDVEFQDVTFSYAKGETVLQDFNLQIKAGQTIALVGETGSGKSTIVNLVCRFYEPTEGSVLVDGRDVRERSQLWLQSNLGYVLQQPHLFSGTIRENIRYGHLEASDEEVEAAARLVHAEEFILRMENGYDTQVGEGGGRLSTGEKQLISFARAIIANPRLFVLDEATSSVDTEAELVIQNAIQSVLEGRTSFVVAHRLSTIRSADRILVINKGHVIEDGSHQELMQQQGHYYQLYTKQFHEEERTQALIDLGVVKATAGSETKGEEEKPYEEEPWS